MIDSHCHLDHEPLLSDLTNVIKRSKEIGIKKLLTISTSFESFDRIKTIIQKDEMIYGTIGIHPHETNENKITSDIIIKNITENDKIIGIGETGLDFYYNNSEKDNTIRLNTIVYTTLEIVRKISYLLYPIIPQSSVNALKIFNLNDSHINLTSIENNEFLSKGSKINKIGILFKKIDKNND